jgi:hypothetical protein
MSLGWWLDFPGLKKCLWGGGWKAPIEKIVFFGPGAQPSLKKKFLERRLASQALKKSSNAYRLAGQAAKKSFWSAGWPAKR